VVPGPFVLAVDLGTGGPKVALISVEGVVVDHTYRTNDLILLPDGGVEQDPEQWWTTITGGIKELVGRGHVPVDQIAAISITSQWMTTVPVGAEGHHVGNAISWMDTRGAPYAQRVSGGGVAVPTVGYNARKLRHWLRVTGGIPSRTGKDPVGQMLFLKHGRPDVYEAAAKFLEPMDYLNLRLTGRAVAAYDTIVGHWATDNRDLSKVDYDDQLVEWIGVDRSKLPELVPTGSIIGPLTAAVAAELGLPATVQVVAGTGDTASAGIGSGAVRDLEGHLYIGTSSWLSCHVPFKKTDIFSNITSLPSGIPGRYWVATEQDTAGKCLTWLLDEVLYADDALAVGARPDDVFDRVNQLAAGIAPGSGNVIFLPWLNGERTPVDNHHLRGGWFNVALGTGRADLVRSVLEGVALNTRWMNQATEKFTKQRFEHLNFIGGGARSPLWCQILADVLDRPIRQVADPVLANARGAAFSASVALGHLGWEDIPSRVEIVETFRPDPANRVAYDRLFETFVDLYKKNKGLYARLNRRGARAGSDHS
jgi:xylulokinase